MTQSLIPENKAAASLVALNLEAVIIAVTDRKPRLLVSLPQPGEASIPSGPLDADSDSTLELGLRRWVRNRTQLELGYVEQLYTFGDRDRRRNSTPPIVSVAYLALVHEQRLSADAAWVDYYDLFPWENHQGRMNATLEEHLIPQLQHWAGQDALRNARVRECFGMTPMPWDPVRALERYELLYEAGLVAEYFIDHGNTPPETLHTGKPLAHDHRRIAASALGRLRGKLTYRPVVFELLPDTFTLTQLQQTVEALVGQHIHKQNFRRLVEQGRLVEGTGQQSASTGGRPAELFRFRQAVRSERPRPGLL